MKNLFTIITLFLALPALQAQEPVAGQTIYASNFTIDEKARNCTFYIPLHYGNKETYPLLFMLHNEAGNAAGMIKTYGNVLHRDADSNAAIIVYPDAAGGKWNADGSGTVNDVGFLSILADYFVQRYQGDANRIYMAGTGNGGTMARYFACSLPSKTAAAAVFVKERSAGCTTSVPVMPVTAIQWINDRPDTTTMHNMWRFLLQHPKP